MGFLCLSLILFSAGEVRIEAVVLSELSVKDGA